MKNCSYCNKEFEPKKPKAIYCSEKCRTYAFRVKKSNAKQKKEKVDGVVHSSSLISPKYVLDNYGKEVYDQVMKNGADPLEMEKAYGPIIKFKAKTKQIHFHIKQMPKGLTLQQQLDWKIANS